MPRLLQCLDCLTLDKLPDFEGDFHDDVLLENLISEKHCFPNGERHRGNLFSVEQKTWDRLDVRTQIEKDIWKEQYERAATRDTYEMDALACYNKHNRPKEGCIDWKDDRKRIGNPTTEGWRQGRVKVYLCDFCPVKSWVATSIRHKNGQYR